MNVSLTQELEQFVNQKVKSGKYQTASEVVREALRLLVERDDGQLKRLEDLRRQIDMASRQASRREAVPRNAKKTSGHGQKKRRTGKRR